MGLPDSLPAHAGRDEQAECGRGATGDGECPTLERLEKRRAQRAAGQTLNRGKAFQRGKTASFLAPYA